VAHVIVWGDSFPAARGASVVVCCLWRIVAVVTSPLQLQHPRAVDTQDADMQVIPPCYAWGKAWLAWPLWLRKRMSGYGPVSAGRSPVFVRPTTGAVSRRSCGFVLPLPFKCLRAGTRTKGIGATYMLPRGGRLRVCCCDQMALAALPRYAATFTWLLLSRQPRSRCWSRMLPTMKSHGPFWLP